MNSPGSWKCICNKGWYPDPKDARLPTCKDVNECVDVPNSCPVQSKCVNTEGSYIAAVSPAGETKASMLASISTNVPWGTIVVRQTHTV